ncbi:MAG TPA: AMP-binding protein [Burkholderiales bacterium]|nr:AMP-binding protein [Burkholderiales bacterium]
MRVESFLLESARRFPGKTALVAGGTRLTYAELGAAATRFAAELRRQGVVRGDRVVIYLQNSPEAVISVFGTLLAGGVFSVVNPSTKADKLAYILNNCTAKALVTEPRLAETARAARAEAPAVAALLTTPFAFPDAPAPRAAGIDLDVAMIVYTSGSTGFPKGVTMTHANIVAAATSITTYLESSPDDIVLSVLPLAFDYGLYQALMCAKVGATLILEKSFAFPQVILDKLKAERVTGFPLVPTMAALLLQMKQLEPGMFSTLRYITNTAAALPKAHIQRLRELFPSARVFSMYGLTECKRCTYLPPEELDRRPESVGIAIPGTEAYVVDELGQRVGPGVTGELVIRGAHVMKGYWCDDAATARALKTGPYPWEKVLYTGDLFRMDEEGFLYFVSRKDDIIKTRGEKVSPKEVENVLYELAGVREVCVIGVPDPILGQALKAIVAADEGVTDRDIIRHCRERLEDFMVPSVVEFRSQLPKSENGKIARKELVAA